MGHSGERFTVTVDYGLEEYKQIVQDFLPQYLESRHENRNRYWPWNWPVTEKAMMFILVPLIFKWKKSKVGVCEFTFSKSGLTRRSRSGSASRSWDQVARVHELSTAYPIELNSGGAMPVPYRVLTQSQRALLESFAARAGHSTRP